MTLLPPLNTASNRIHFLILRRLALSSPSGESTTQSLAVDLGRSEHDVQQRLSRLIHAKIVSIIDGSVLSLAQKGTELLQRLTRQPSASSSPP